MSWNGATGVRRWQLLRGPQPDTLRPIATVARSGFETSIAVPHGIRYLTARALGAGRSLATSRTVRVR